MTLVRFNSEMPELANIMNNLFDRSPLFPHADHSFQPAVNVTETADNYLLEFAVPGFKKEDFKVEVNNHVLTVSTEIEEVKREEGNVYTRREFAVKPFSRSFNLSKQRIDDGQIEARYENGILALRLAKREEAKPKPSRLIDIA